MLSMIYTWPLPCQQRLPWWAWMTTCLESLVMFLADTADTGADTAVADDAGDVAGWAVDGMERQSSPATTTHPHHSQPLQSSVAAWTSTSEHCDTQRRAETGHSVQPVTWSYDHNSDTTWWVAITTTVLYYQLYQASSGLEVTSPHIIAAKQISRYWNCWLAIFLVKSKSWSCCP